MDGSEDEVVTLSAQELRCPNCGAPWEMRGFQTTRTVACESCGSVIDTSGQDWQLVQKVEGAYRAKPRYALGTRGELDGVQWEVIGWQARSVRSWGDVYRWEEHLLYNPYEGFRYLMYQDGHFVVVTPIAGFPSTSVNRATYKKQSFRHFSTADAEVDEVLGEFPWEVKRGDVATATDYVDPPHILSSDESEGELVWSAGRYLTHDEVVQAFGQPTRKVRSPKGIHPCQPNPDKRNFAWVKWAAPAAFAIWLVLSLFYVVSRDREVLWSGQVPFAAEGARPELQIDGSDEQVLELEAGAPLTNKWAYVKAVLVGPLDQPGAEQGRYIDGLELSYWRGPGWSEGSQSSSVTVGGIPPGRYVLQLKQDPARNPRDRRSQYKRAVRVAVKRDVTVIWYPCCSFFLVIAIPVLVAARYFAFEARRWSESDHAG